MPRRKKAKVDEIKPIEPDGIIPPRKAGRPSGYNEQTATEICHRMINGESLVKICKDDHMPSRVTVYDWMEAHPDFRTRCARAREGLADFLVDEIEELAATTDESNVNSMKVKISTKQWRAMKMAPRIYGDRTTTEITGANGAPIQLEARRTINLEAMDDETLQQVEQALRLALEHKSDS
jgi:hypothetical protein